MLLKIHQQLKEEVSSAANLESEAEDIILDDTPIIPIIMDEARSTGTSHISMIGCGGMSHSTGVGLVLFGGVDDLVIKNGNKIHLDETFEDKAKFILNYYDLDTGLYVLTVIVTETLTTSRKTSDKCLIKIRPEMPVPVISGGTMRVVQNNVKFSVDGKYSINLDVKPELKAMLNYRWNCTCTTNPNNNFCKQDEISFANMVEFPGSNEGDKFIVYLHVSTDYSPWITTHQEIHVIREARSVNIECLKNCHSVINYKSNVYLKATCQDCESKEFNWKLIPDKSNSKTNINFDSDTVYGSSNPKLVIKKDILVPGDKYTFFAYYKDGKSFAAKSLTISSLPKISGKCSINPQEGESTLTLFTIKCDKVVHTEPVTFSLYQVAANIGSLFNCLKLLSTLTISDMLVTTSYSENFDVYLSAGTTETVQLFVKITDPDLLYITSNLTVKVTSFINKLPNDGKMIAILKKYRETVPNLIEGDNTERTMQMLNSLISETALASGSDDLKQNFKKIVINDLSLVSIEVQNDVEQKVAILKCLFNIATSRDREFTRMSAELSSIIARQQQNLLNSAPFPEFLYLEIDSVVSNCLWVANEVMKAYISDLDINSLNFTVTTPESLLTYPIVLEDYPDYNDADLNYLDRIRECKQTTKMAIDTITLTGLNIAKTLTPGEPIFNADEKLFTIQILTDGAHAQIGKKFGISGAKVIGSLSLTDYNDVIYGVVSVFPENPYWWHVNDMNTSTSILNANYFEGDKVITNLNHPLLLLFTANWINPKRAKGEVSVSKNSSFSDEDITVHRVDVIQGAALIVDFYDFEDNTLQITVTHNRRPRIADFDINYFNVTKLKSTRIFLFPTELMEYGNTWFYIGVFANKNLLQNVSSSVGFKYEISFVAAFCNYWSNAFEKWINGAHAQIGKKFGISGAKVIGSLSLTDYNDVIYGVVSVFPENPYWWHVNDMNTSTSILNANYFEGDKVITNLNHPLLLLFTANWINPKRAKGEVSVSKNSSFSDEDITVHRVDVIQGAALIVDFYDFEDNTLQITVTHNRRPRIADFDINYFNVTKLKSTRIFLFPTELMEYGNTWFYIGVLTNKNLLQNVSSSVSFKYEISFVAAFCNYWSNAFEKWISSDCQTKELTSKKQIHCHCTHHSSYVGTFLNAPNKLDKIEEIKFELEPCTSWIILIFVSSTVCIYCTALVYRGFRKTTLLFLTDNQEKDNYFYLIVVKTGSQCFAGTTSNVGLKIYGSSSKSRPHLINYPDCEKKLLQRNNEDWFVIGTETSLGPLKHIWIWFDSVGVKPSWYCQRISVIDLQTEKQWHFNVNSLLSVLDNGYCKVFAEPSVIENHYNWRNVLNHHTWNLTKTYNDNLSYHQRITIILSTILTTCTITLLFYGVPNFRRADGLGYGHYQVFPEVLLITCLSSFISFGANLVFVIKFKNGSTNSAQKRTWILLVVTITIHINFLIILGIWVPHFTGLLWLTSVVGALILVVLLEIVRAFYGTKRTEGEIIVNSKDVLEETIIQKERLLYTFGNTLLRPYFSNKYQSMSVEERKVSKEQEILRQNLTTLTQDLVMFTVYIVLLFFVVLANRDAFIVYSNKEITELFVNDDFQSLTTLDNFVEYINNTFIQKIHSITWYGSWNSLEPGLITDFSSKILGVARIRQHRVCTNCCKVPKLFRNLECRPEFSTSDSDIGEYMEYWKQGNHTAVPRLADAWTYQYDAMKTFGHFMLYPGEGYSAPLGRTTHNSYYNFFYYLQTNWIDANTRALFIEFLLYNVNYNIFHVVTVIAEKSATGLVSTSHNVVSTRLLFVNQEMEMVLIIEIIAFVIIICIMIIKNLTNAKRQWKSYVKDKWNIVDLFIIVMCILCMGIYEYRINLVGRFLDDLEKARHNQFINFFQLIHIEYVLTIFGAVLICVSVVRLWKFLRFISDFKVFEVTLWRSGRSLIGLAFCHFLIWCMYTLLGAIIFGPRLPYFHTLHSTITILMLLSMNLYSSFDYELFFAVGGTFAYVYFLSYVLVMMTIITLYVSVIMISYSQSNNNFSNLTEYYSLKKYAHDEFLYHKELWRRNVCCTRLSGGEDFTKDTKKVIPKNDEHRFSNLVALSSMQLLAMLLVTQCVSDNSSNIQRSSHNSETMGTLIYYLCKSKVDNDRRSNTTGFFETDEDKIQFVFDHRLLQMEYIVNEILQLGVQENSEINNFEKDEEKKQKLTHETIVVNDTTTIDKLDEYLQTLTGISKFLDNITVIT
ncbi:hypothetical protein FQA39_LY06002 [Lamprigera yunnana]|nr:hypothetical protein FQA39_LY06002 [Lamprigera yunnana]